MKSGVFAGTFDPVTNGHLDLIHRALGVVDRLVVAVAPRPEKGVLFALEDRVAMIKEAVGAESRVTVEPFQGLLVEHAKARQIPIIIRGVRFVSDFEYEFQMALMNRRLDPTIETIFLMPSEQYTYVNSTLVKEIARHGGDVNPFVPPNVRERLDKALRKAAAR
ncbi:MAG TPA: pantetheine-phosphate adenylyltransferase [Candidatus Eisenbacteria bacterium]|jgi:pantetheine-phosphate adenylyltransferase|nr:pantetheine-phosphate adenylyltransferase [Candidatus Eisenbacteria bacterium]